MKTKERVINQKVYDDAINFGCSEVVSKILAARIDEFHPNMVHIDSLCMEPASRLKDCSKAAKRIAEAIKSNEKIILLTDYDVDGCTSRAILYSAINRIFGLEKNNIEWINNDRLKDGYGFSDRIIELICKLKPNLVITADVGISEDIAVKKLKDQNIDVIITDHHIVPTDFPNEAFAVVNPQQSDCNYDKDIAGCGVAWLLMTEVCNFVDVTVEQKQLIYELLDFVALGTVADMVSLASPVNRFFVKKGLEFINRRQRPCWMAVEEKKVGVGTLGYQIGPRVNAVSRMSGSPELSIKFLLSESVVEANDYYKQMTENNERRKKIESKMMSTAIDKIQKDQPCFIVYDNSFNSGIQGVVCSKIVEYYKRPAILFAGPDEYGYLHGSGRAGLFLHLRDALQTVEDVNPGILVSFGGHKAAAGLKIKLEDLELFKQSFTEIVKECMKDVDTTFYHLTDGQINTAISCELIDEIESLSPFGMGFPAPVFCDRMTMDYCKIVGKIPIHLSCSLDGYKAIQFNALKKTTDESPVQQSDKVEVLYKLDKNSFRGETNPQLIIQDLEVL